MTITPTQHPHPSGELPEAHRPRQSGSFDATVATFAAMRLFDALTADQRARVLLPHSDPAEGTGTSCQSPADTASRWESSTVARRCWRTGSLLIRCRFRPTPAWSR